VLWLSEPDYSQHYHGPVGRTLAAIRNCDQRLAAVLNELDRRGNPVRERMCSSFRIMAFPALAIRTMWPRRITPPA